MTDSPGADLALLLLGGFRSLVDDLHAELAHRGHPDVRPVHGFALQAIAGGARTAAELAARLGVSKQAAAKTIRALDARGYLSRERDNRDGRRMQLRITDRGPALLRESAAIFDELRERWAKQIGLRRLALLEEDLAALAPTALRLDTPGWLAPPGASSDEPG